jgi:aminoglycoside/choline kinase family phosphotransferase
MQKDLETLFFKAHYIHYLPRVWAHFQRNLSHPLLAPIAAFVEKHIPPDYRGAFDVDVTIGGIAA